VSQTTNDKLCDNSDAAELCSSIYDDLVRFVKWLASSNHDENDIMMDYDEIVGELLLELVKGVAHYRELPREKLLAVIKKMMDNRISELRYKYYLTHRKAHASQISLERTVDKDDTMTEEECPSEELVDIEAEESVEGIAESNEIVQQVRSRLSANSLKVFDTVIVGNNPRMLQFIALNAERTAYVRGIRGGKVKITKDIVANAAILPRRAVRYAYREISAVYREVTDGR